MLLAPCLLTLETNLATPAALILAGLGSMIHTARSAGAAVRILALLPVGAASIIMDLMSDLSHDPDVPDDIAAAVLAALHSMLDAPPALLSDPDVPTGWHAAGRLEGQGRRLTQGGIRLTWATADRITRAQAGPGG